jgi:hypothetical protein
MAKPQQREVQKAASQPDDGLFDDAPSSEPVVESPVLAVAEEAQVEPVAAEVILAEGFSAFPLEPPEGRYSKEPPYDHAPVWLTNGEHGAVGQWQVTRRWDGPKKRWGPVGFWALRATGGRPVGFTPTGWRVWRD